jgi:hypothetical protein
VFLKSLHRFGITAAYTTATLSFRKSPSFFELFAVFTFFIRQLILSAILSISSFFLYAGFHPVAALKSLKCTSEKVFGRFSAQPFFTIFCLLSYKHIN